MDQVEVEYHPDSYDLFFKPLEAEHPELMRMLLEDFRTYQQSMRQCLPDYFGYDAEYGYPPEVAGCLEHIHLCIPPRIFPKNAKQAYRKCRKGDPDNDVALVYARGLFEPHRFVILGILAPDAHGKARNDLALMRYLGSLARAFRRDN
ncbi:type II toxin-antitoxin system YafO family toxin [Stutzerimonas nitrititolerans]|uniref:type II toxin-antitoxin system YafO family toxin n=1 Tax=Stutzerimonas nitrititolerans TaxID=2482751 RepID=UPI0028AB02AE|nr:type II toxin-antitoxin system YafO family toxin [Stutzerimonas nitrititolerans]